MTVIVTASSQVADASPIRVARGPMVYIAGPYTLPDPWRNTKAAIACGDRLLESGLVVPVVPHLTYLWDRVHRRSVGDWYAYDIAILNRCDALLRLPGESRGADAEVAHARTMTIAVFESERDLLAWAAASERRDLCAAAPSLA